MLVESLTTPSNQVAHEKLSDRELQTLVMIASGKRLSDIANAVKGADTVILATDPDREGEAISWHVLEVLKGKRVLITAGGTREPLDSVRFLGNRSSGKMGVALADEALARGADVTTILSNTLVRPMGGTQIDAPTAADLATATQEHAKTADIVLMAAAVADFRPAEAQDTKRARTDAWDLHLEPTEDILAGIAQNRQPNQTIIGFAAEDSEDIQKAQQKRERKGVDLIVLNDISDPAQGFDSDDNAVVLVSATDETRVERASKPQIAAAILDRVEALNA
jgi:phosphopantothenoylcysteine decarboxylase/phosphopantothenate--cysteine ligase